MRDNFNTTRFIFIIYIRSKKKPIGYGTHCHINLYFDGILCCPKVRNGQNSAASIVTSTSERNNLQYLDEPRFKPISPPQVWKNRVQNYYNQGQYFKNRNSDRKNYYNNNFALYNEI